MSHYGESFPRPSISHNGFQRALPGKNLKVELVFHVNVLMLNANTIKKQKRGKRIFLTKVNSHGIIRVQNTKLDYQDRSLKKGTVMETVPWDSKRKDSSAEGE